MALRTAIFRFGFTATAIFSSLIALTDSNVLMLQGCVWIRLVSGGSKRVLLNWTAVCVQSSSITRCLSHATSLLKSISYNRRPFLNPVQYHKPFLSVFAFARLFVSDSYLANMASNRFACDYARLGTSSCKKCKQKLEKGSLRLAKLTANPFSEGDGDMKQYFHPKCLFETFLKARSTTKVIEDPEDLEGFQDLKDEDKDVINELIKDLSLRKGSPPKRATPKKTPPASSTNAAAAATGALAPEPMSTSDASDAAEKDNSFRQFRKLCADLAEENSYNGKTAIVEKYITKGTTGAGFQGDLHLLLKLLLARVIKTVYNLESKQLAKHFSQIFRLNQDEMVEDLEQGDAAETVRVFFEKSRACPPQTKSVLSIQDVDKFLNELSQYTRDDDQQKCLEKIAKRCTSNDLKMIVRLIKHDLRINCGAKHVYGLDALDPNAYEAFKASRNLEDVIDRVMQSREETSRGGMVKRLSVRANLMTAVQPMLAEACKSVEQAFKRCPNGMYAEIKYDGERVQVHKQGDEFLYYSRSLKPVQPHKVQHFKDFIPKAFPKGCDLILDSEVLLIDTKTSKPLPFGSLGVHKKNAFKDANVGLFVFDCLHYNGENLMKKPIKERRKILRENMVEIPNRILFSEMQHINDPDDLGDLMMKVFREGLEGLVLKDVDGVYEPGKRHWLKVKKDYLAEGAMADSADLVVLGAYFGTGSKGGIMSIFLMGVYDSDNSTWCTVTKCGSGFDDKTLDKLQKNLQMVKISKDFSKVPSWLNVTKTLVPDFVAADPKKSQVWEITGAEFSKSDSHTAAGISIRFPRCTKMRDDKTWKEATDLKRLKALFAKSKEYSDIPDVISRTPKKKRQPAKNSDEDDEDEDISDKPNPPRLGKRKAEQELTDTPAKREKKEDPRTVCKYGASCYQTNLEHRKAFYHPGGTEPGKGGTESGKSSKFLPDLFHGMKFYIRDSMADQSKLRRYIIAYDGDLVESFDKGHATHIVAGAQSEVDESDRCVSVEWVWSCIKAQQILPVSK